MSIKRVVPLVVLVVAACVPGRRATLRPGSDMALPAAPKVSVEKKNGETCITVLGVSSGDHLKCSPLAPDSTRRPPPAAPTKPAARP